MSTSANDPLAGWDPRRRAALERVRAEFRAAGAGKTLVDELIAERRLAAAAEDGIDPNDPEFGVPLPPPSGEAMPSYE
ncbi:MAG: hypothetical protein ACOYBY_05710 [Dermatophilaceae bacterium]